MQYLFKNVAWAVLVMLPVSVLAAPKAARTSVVATGTKIAAATTNTLGFPCSSVVKNSSTNAGEVSSIPVLGRSPGVENGNPLQFSCPENLMDRGAWQASP